MEPRPLLRDQPARGEREASLLFMCFLCKSVTAGAELEHGVGRALVTNAGWDVGTLPMAVAVEQLRHSRVWAGAAGECYSLGNGAAPHVCVHPCTGTVSLTPPRGCIPKQRGVFAPSISAKRDSSSSCLLPVPWGGGQMSPSSPQGMDPVVRSRAGWVQHVCTISVLWISTGMTPNTAGLPRDIYIFSLNQVAELPSTTSATDSPPH